MSQGWNWTASPPPNCQQRYQQPQQPQLQAGTLQPLCSGPPPTDVGHQQPPTSLPPYKSDLGRKELEDSSAVVSSTQDEPDPEPHQARYCPAPNSHQDMHRDDQLRGAKQDHFGNLIGIISELQESPCSENDIYQLISGGEYTTEIKTESAQYDAMSINSQQTELEYLSQQELHSSSYNRQHSADTGYNTRYRDENVYHMQYPTHLPLKSTVTPGTDTSPVNHSDSRLGLYSPVSPESSQGDRPRDDKYWERRRKNNLAAKKSRDARRVRENQLRLRVLCSENQIRILRSQLEQAKETIQDLKKQMRQYEGDTSVNHETYENLETVGVADGGGGPSGGAHQPTGGHQEYHDLEPPDKDRMDIKINSAPRYQDMDARYGDHIMNGGVG